MEQACPGSEGSGAYCQADPWPCQARDIAESGDRQGAAVEAQELGAATNPPVPERGLRSAGRSPAAARSEGVVGLSPGDRRSESGQPQGESGAGPADPE